MRVARWAAWVLLGVLVAAALSFLLRLLAPRRTIRGGEVAYQAPVPSDGGDVAVEHAVPLLPLR